ncbi:MAG: phosphoribosylamine--glycine ligase [Bacillota bacterium]
MRVMVVGDGGREHALVWKLVGEDEVDSVFAVPGNPGTADIANNVQLKLDNTGGLIDFARSQKIDLTFVGPEAPLVQGLVDEFQQAGLAVFGPPAAGARLEGSKVFAKEFMDKAGIPTADYRIFEEAGQALSYVDDRELPLVVKADGLAAGKGVTVAQTRDQACQAVEEIMIEKKFGQAGDRVIIEEMLEGQEATVLAVIQPTLAELQTRGIDYRGILYCGLMIKDSEPVVLEYNVRFGDPEAQAILPLLETDLTEIARATLEGRLEEAEIKWKSKSAACVVMASGGYPGDYETGKEITGLEQVKKMNNTVVFQAGTACEGNRLITDGGRVLGVTGVAGTLEQAITRSYEGVAKINFAGAHYRSDIGSAPLERVIYHV